MGGGRGGRAAAAAELAVALLVVPVALVLVGATPTWPSWPNLSHVRSLFLSVSTDGLSAALIHPVIWLVWMLWAYLLFALALSAAGHLLGRGAKGGSALLGLRRFLVPKALCAVIDVVLVGSLALGAVGSPRSTWLQAAVAATASPTPSFAATAPVAPTHPAVPTSSPPSGPTTYVVQRGDTLSGIALKRYGSAKQWPAIWKADEGQPEGHGQRFDDPNLIQPGWTIELPEAATAAPPPAAVTTPRTYIVQPGDTLSGIAEKELGSEADEPALAEANLGHVMDDHGDVLRIARYIQPGWRLQLPIVEAPPTDVGPAASGPAAPTAPSTPSVGPAAPPAPAATPVPAAAGTPHRQAASAPVAPGRAEPRPTPAATASKSDSHPAGTQHPAVTDTPAHSAPRLAPAAQGRTHGVRIPGGVLPYSVAAGVAAVAYLARLRRRSRRSLADPEPRRADGPILGALGGVPPVMDSITPNTLALLAAYQGAGHKTLPRVLGAWAAEKGVCFLLDADPESLPNDRVEDASGITVEFGVRDGHAVGVTTATKEPAVCLRREVVPFVDEILVPVGRLEGEGWFYLPLLNEPIALAGAEAPSAAWSMLASAALRTGGEDLRISVAGHLLDDARLPEGVELPALEVMSPAAIADLSATLREEAHERARAVRAEGFDSFADLSTLWPSLISAWVLVVDPETAEACAGELAELATLGVGALVLGDSSAAPRKVNVEVGGSVTVAVPYLGSFHGLAAFKLPAGVVDELEAECVPVEAGIPAGWEEGSALEPADPGVDEVASTGESEARIRMYLMGGFRVVRDGVEVPMATTDSALARELSARLAVAGTSVPMRELLEDLYPDDLDAQVTKVQPFFQSVTRARRWLLGASKGEASTTIIENQPGRTRAEGASYCLRGVWVDVAAFRAAAGRGTRQGLEEACKLYAGELLAGQESETHYRWVKAGGYRDAERFRFYGVVVRLAQDLLAEGDPDRALEILDRALETRDGTSVEDLAAMAMRCEAARGNADGVRRRYARLCSALEADEASAPTAELCRSLLESLETAPPPRSPRSPQTGLHLVGREGQVRAASGGS
jgi:LysM repeat protein/DNA-binding SARP family transcriptional activator